MKKGETTFPILVPIVGKRTAEDPNTGEEVEHVWIGGFTSAAVFGLSQTDGDPLPPADPAVAGWLESLPLRQVAESWGLSVDAYNGRPSVALGKYRHGAGIALGVENLATWARELCHAADDRLGNPQERGRHWRSETVAELGGATLLEALGYELEADRGGCWECVNAYASDAGIEPITAFTTYREMRLPESHRQEVPGGLAKIRGPRGPQAPSKNWPVPGRQSRSGAPQLVVLAEDRDEPGGSRVDVG